MKTASRPALERVSPGFGSSFTVKHYDQPSKRNKPPFWHVHPEIEMVYIKGGAGKRHIGNHISYYHSGDLVLIGSMLPHFGFTDRLTRNKTETVVQFNDGLGNGMFELEEMKAIRQLLERAKSGIAFHGEAKERIGERLEGLVQLDNFARVIELLNILQEMAKSSESTLLNAAGFTFEVEQGDNDRINKVYSFVQNNYTRAIPLQEIADIANMTVPSFCRYFKKIAGKNFTRFVNEIRIVQACKLLSEQELSVTNVAFDTGFNNFSHFNRLFKEITGERPSDYRKQFKKVLL